MSNYFFAARCCPVWCRRTRAASSPPVVRDRQISNGAGSGDPALQVVTAACWPLRVLGFANDGEGNPLACAWGRRGPKPYGEGRAFFYRGASKSIKDLKDLRAFCISAAIDMQVLTDLKRTRDVFFVLGLCLLRWLRSSSVFYAGFAPPL